MSEPIGSCVYTVRKRCYLCGIEWDGNAFTKQPEGAVPLPGMCAECGRKEDEAMARLQAHQTHSESGENLPELERPRRASDAADEDYRDFRERAAGA